MDPIWHKFVQNWRSKWAYALAPRSIYQNRLSSNRTLANEIHHPEIKSHLFKNHFFQCLASGHLALVSRASKRLVVRFVPVFGAPQYKIVARNTEAGPLQGPCHTGTCMCDIMRLRPATVYTLWFRTCKRESFFLCDLRAVNSVRCHHAS